MDYQNTLNILNGQSMLNFFKQHNLIKNGIYVPFNEAMCVGEGTSDIFSDEFNKLRSIAHQVTTQQYNDITLKPLKPLFENDFSSIVLWFDDDMFCQINMLTLLAYLDQKNYRGIVTFNLVGHKFEVVESLNLGVEGYNELYKQVMINKCVPKNVNLFVMKKGISLYFEYLREENEITAFIRQHQHLKSDNLLLELFKVFPHFGLGDTQYMQLIESFRKKE